MQWLGLGAAQAALLFGASAALLTALYLVRKKPSPRDVPRLALWEALRLPEGGGLFGRPRQPLALALALCIALLLVLALRDPRPARPEGRSLVVLLDRGVAMAASDEHPDRMARAKALLAELARGLTPDDRALLVALDEQATPLSSWSERPGTLIEAARAVVPGASGADLARGVQRALELLHGAQKPQIVLLSAGALRGVEAARSRLAAAPEVEVAQVVIGREQRNLALTRLSARPYPFDPRHHEVWLAAHNAGARLERARLRLALDDTPLFEEELWLAPRSSVNLAFPDLINAGGELRAELRPLPGPDPLPRDDSARLALLAPKPTRVLVVSPGNRYLEAALLLDENLEVRFQPPGAPIDAQRADIAIFDRALPDAPAALPALVLAPYVQSPAQPLPPRGSLARPFIDRFERDHPLLRGLSLSDVNIGRAARTAPAKTDSVLASSAAALPLIVEGERQGQRFIALTFDPRESDLPLRPAFPLFLLAAIDRLAHPDQARAALASAGRAPAQADIAPRALFARLEPAELRRRASLAARGFPWQLLLLLALALLACDWLAYHLRPGA
jgi:Ca-activated chloride channel homolog